MKVRHPVRSVFGALLLLACASVATVSCKGLDLNDLLGPKEGGRCEPDTAQCIDRKSQLWCVNGKFIKRSCAGGNGCRTNEASNLVTCDWETDLAGTRCAPTEDNEAGCSEDGKTMLRCERGEISPWSCGGPSGCSELANGKVNCDGSIGTVGERCAFEGPACDADGMTSLMCTDDKLVKGDVCRGPKGCKAYAEGDGWRVECDRSVASVGDTCPGEGAACSVDKKAFLECKGGRYVATLNCLGKDACQAKAGNISCDASIANVGDPCSDATTSACSLDAKAVLKCKDGKFALDRKCSCAVEGDFVMCK